MSNTIPPVAPNVPQGTNVDHDQEVINTYLDHIDNSDIGSRITADNKIKSVPSGIPGISSPTNMDPQQLIALLSNMMRKLQLRAISLQQGSVEDRQKKQQVDYADNKKKIEKQRQKTHKAKKSGLLMKILGWVAASLAIVASAIVAVVSFGAGAPLVAACAVLGATLAVTMTVLSETGAMEKMMKPMVEAFTSLAKACGASDASAKMIGNIMAQVVVAAIVIGIQIGLTIVSCGAGAGGAAANLTARFASISAKVAKVATKAIQTTIVTTQVLSGLSTIGQGSAGIAAGVYTKQASDAKADSVLLKAEIESIQNAMDSIREFMALIIKMMGKNMGNINSMVDLQHNARSKVIEGHKSYV